MNTLSECTSFSSRDGKRIVSASVLIVNFRSLKLYHEGIINKDSTTSLSSLDYEEQKDIKHYDMFHSVAGLYSAALPDMELDAIYSTLTKPCRTVVVMATVDSVLDYRKKHGPPKLIEITDVNTDQCENKSDINEKEKINEIKEEEEEYDDPYCSLFSDEEEEEEEEDGAEEVKDNNFEPEREEFLTRVKERQKIDYLDPLSVGIEDQLIGCATFMKISSKPGDSSIQILLLAVRNRWRGCGIGQYLLSLCKDPSIVSHYDLLLTYADHKAEQFFSKHGFTDDPIITARHRNQTDYWENSTLMAYIPPYSAPVAGSLKSLQSMEDQIKTWRLLSVASHCEQVCVMERLHHEVLLLHARVSSQQEIIDTLHSELRQAHHSKQALEREFEHYRVKMKEKMASLMESKAREWLKDLEINSSNGITHDDDTNGKDL